MKYLLSLIPLLMWPILSHAAEVKTFVTIPFLEGTVSTESYIQALYSIAIATAAILAVIRIIWNGAEYMLSGSITGKQANLSKLKNALLGLLIILAAVTILNTLNPSLNNLDVIGKGSPVTITSTGDISSGDGGTLDFEPGQTITGADVAYYCSNFFSGTDDECVGAYEDTMAASCTENGGTLDWETDITVTINSYSWYSYTCNYNGN